VNTGGTVTEHDAVLVGERGCTLRVPLTVTAATMVIICDLFTHHWQQKVHDVNRAAAAGRMFPESDLPPLYTSATMGLRR